MFDRRATGEGEPSRPAFEQFGRRPVEVFSFGHGLVAGDVVHDSAQGFERLGEFAIRHLSAQQTNFQVLDALKFGEGLGDI